MKNIFLLCIALFAITILPAQQIGINTNQPTRTLDVNGTMRIRGGNPAAGKVLTSSADGSASWEQPSASAGSGNGTVGYGTWGDCGMGVVSQYQPMADTTIQLLEEYGAAVAMYGNYAAVSAPSHKISLAEQGGIFIYFFNGSTWEFKQKLFDAQAASGDRLGFSLAMYGNYLVAGIPLDNVGNNVAQGSIIIYELINGTWVTSQKITEAGGQANDRFGYSVAISNQHLLVGIPNDDAFTNQGSVNVYKLQNGSWLLAQKLWDQSGQAEDIFGFSVAISGHLAVVGAPGDDYNTMNNLGSAVFYHFDGTQWLLSQKITDYTTTSGDALGTSISLSGNMAALGMPLAKVGDTDKFGKVLILKLVNNQWQFVQFINNDTGQSTPGLGQTLSMAGDLLMIGLPDYSVGTGSGGAAWAYRRFGAGFARVQIISDPAGQDGDSFGKSLVLDAPTQRFVVGARDYVSYSGKVIFGKLY